MYNTDLVCNNSRRHWIQSHFGRCVVSGSTAYTTAIVFGIIGVYGLHAVGVKSSTLHFRTIGYIVFSLFRIVVVDHVGWCVEKYQRLCDRSGSRQRRHWQHSRGVFGAHAGVRQCDTVCVFVWHCLATLVDAKKGKSCLAKNENERKRESSVQ